MQLCIGRLSFIQFTDGLDLLAPYFPAMLRVIGLMGRLGMTMILSLLSDLLSVLTGHLYLSYLIATVVFSRLLNVAHSLWNLFRGKIITCCLNGQVSLPDPSQGNGTMCYGIVRTRGTTTLISFS